MLTNLKALIVVLAIAMAVFIIARPICLRFMAEDDFARRRNVWFALTLTAFASPSFWLFVLLAAPVLAWGARKDTNPVAFYVIVMHLISPTVGFHIPVVGVNNLFELDLYRILSIVVLIPAAWRLMRSTDKSAFGKLVWTDVLILAYGVLQLVYLIPYESPTNTLRRGFLFLIDVLVVYFVVSRTCTNRRAIVDTMASFCVASAILAPLALVETLKNWLLYGSIAVEWGVSLPWDWLFRGDRLRAQVSLGHSLALGYVLAMAFGFWLYLHSHVQSRSLAAAVAIWMWVGLLAAYSRAPWVVAVATFFAYLALGPFGFARLSMALFASALVFGLVLVSPIGERVVDNLPFVGTVDAETVAFRQRLAATSWELIQKNPFFGDPFVILQLESLRNAQNTIDLVNTYAAIGLFHGLVGLCLFLAPFLVGMWNVRRSHKRSAEPDLSLLGANLIACMFGTLVMMATGSFGTVLAKMYYVLAGLAAGYAYCGQLREMDQARPTATAPQPRETLKRA